MLVAGEYASYYDIKYRLDVGDVLDLYEIMVVKQSNINLSTENNRR